MNNTTEQQLRRDLAAAHRLAVRDGLNEGTWNHLSVMCPGDSDLMLISPGYMHWSDVTASSLALVGSDGELVAGAHPPTQAGWIIHYPIHKACPQAVCVMHVHSPYITALSMCKGLRLDTQSSQQAAAFHDDIAYYEKYDGLLQSEDEGASMAAVLTDKRALIMRNHGAVVTGASIGQAYVDLYQLERACMYQILAATTGGPREEIPQQVAASISRKSRSGGNDKFFDGMRQFIENREPDYAS